MLRVVMLNATRKGGFFNEKVNLKVNLVNLLSQLLLVSFYLSLLKVCTFPHFCGIDFIWPKTNVLLRRYFVSSQYTFWSSSSWWRSSGSSPRGDESNPTNSGTCSNDKSKVLVQNWLGSFSLFSDWFLLYLLSLSSLILVIFLTRLLFILKTRGMVICDYSLITTRSKMHMLRQIENQICVIRERVVRVEK